MPVSTCRILYVGDATFAEEIETTAPNWRLWQPEKVNDALAMYIFEEPHVIIVDQTWPSAADLMMHLQSVSAGPIFLLSNHADDWSLPFDGTVYVVPADISAAQLINTIYHRLDWLPVLLNR